MQITILIALIALCVICWRVSVQLGKIETILAVQIKNLDRYLRRLL